MTKKEYLEQVKKLLTTQWQNIQHKLVTLTNEYIDSKATGERENFDQIDYGTNFEYLIDDLALTRAWIEDRLNGQYPKDKKSMTRKMRQILGYTNV